MDVIIQENHKPFKDALELYLKSKPIGSSYSYKTLSAASGTDVLRHRDVIESVRNRLLKHHEKLLVNIRGYGYRIADLEDTLSETSSYRDKSLRSVKKSVQIITTVDLSKLTPAERDKTILEKAKSCAVLQVCKATQNKALLPGTKINSIEQSDVLRLLIS